MLMNNHDYLKRLFSVGLVCFAVLMVLVGCEKGQLSSALVIDAKTGEQIFSLQLDVLCDPGGYAVDICVDEKYIGTVKKEVPFYETVRLAEGAHTIRFNKQDDASVYATATLNATRNDVFSCTLKARQNEIEIVKNELATTNPEPTTTAEPTTEAVTEPETTAEETTQSPERSYILNTHTHRFHYPDCPSVKKMKDTNKQEFYGTREAVMEEGYQPCGQCLP